MQKCNNDSKDRPNWNLRVVMLRGDAQDTLTSDFSKTTTALSKLWLTNTEF